MAPTVAVIKRKRGISHPKKMCLLITAFLLSCQQQQASSASPFGPLSYRRNCWTAPVGFSRLFSQQSPSSPSSSLSSTSSTAALLLHSVPRGGSDSDDDEGENPVTITGESPSDSKEEEGDKEDGDDEDGDEQQDSSDSSEKTVVTKSLEPVTIHFKTNLGNPLLDLTVELNAVRTRNIQSLKQSLARQLPGKPPMEHIRLMQHGVVLENEEVLVDELLEDEDDEDEEGDHDEDDKPNLTLVLDMVPPVDPRFQTRFDEKLNDMTTADLLEAYTLNEAAVWYSSQYWTEKMQQDGKQEENEEEEEEEEETPENKAIAPSQMPISFQLRQYAEVLQSHLQETVVPEKAAPLLEDPVPPAQAARERSGIPQVRGHRVRPGAAAAVDGPSSSVVGLKQTVQHYLNIHWGSTMRSFGLFLAFGYFGGRTVTSRALLYLGAPMCFIIQARPVKLLLKQLVYTLLTNEPGFVLSLLPAPQQACLSLSYGDAMRLIYGADYSDTSSEEEAAGDELDDEEDDDETADDEFEEELVLDEAEESTDEESASDEDD